MWTRFCWCQEFLHLCWYDERERLTPSALRNFTRDVAAPSYIHTDNAYEEVLGEWEEVCKTNCIPQIASEPHQQHHNKAERRIQDIKRRSRLLMQFNDAPEKYWDFAVESATEYCNHIATRKLGWKTSPWVSLWRDPRSFTFLFFILWEDSLPRTQCILPQAKNTARYPGHSKNHRWYLYILYIYRTWTSITITYIGLIMVHICRGMPFQTKEFWSQNCNSTLKHERSESWKDE